MSRANKRMRAALLISSLVLGSEFLGPSRGTAQESGPAKTPVPIRPLTVRRVPTADADPLFSGATESDIAKMKKEIAALQSEIARLKAAAHPTPLAEPVRPENVLIQRRIEAPANVAFQAGKVFTIRVEKAPGQQEELVIVGTNLPGVGAADPYTETVQGTAAEEPLSAKKLEAIHEGFKNMPPAVRQKVIEALHASGSQPVRIQVATGPAAPAFQAKPVQPSVFYHLHATPTAALAPVQAGVTPPPALPMPPSVFPPSVMPPPVAAPNPPIAPAPIPAAPPAPSGEIEQKLNKILEKLDKLEKRLESRDTVQGSASIPAPPIHAPTAIPSGALPVIYPSNPVGNR